jgi:hypothetical protein
LTNIETMVKTPDILRFESQRLWHFAQIQLIRQHQNVSIILLSKQPPWYNNLNLFRSIGRSPGTEVPATAPNPKNPMRKNSQSQTAFFNPRIVITVALCSIGASLAWLSFASTPATDSITVPSSAGQTVSVTWTGTIPVLNNNTSDCSAPFAGTPLVDQHVSTVVVPAGVYNTVDAFFKFKISWIPSTGQETTNDEILTVIGLGSSDGGSTTETVRGQNLAGGDYTSVVCGFNNAEPQNYTATLTITTCAPGTGCLNGGGGPFGGPDPTVPGNPRYQNFYAPTGSGAQSSQGEFNIGFDPITHRIMAMNDAQVWRLTPGEVQTPAQAECCEALWEEKNPHTTNLIAMDPILWTDQKSGRTFASNAFFGANFSYAYTDAGAPFNDGDLWVEAGISPPNGGQDHETIGSGPYPLLSGLPSTPVNQGEMVFYCSQNGEGGAGCQRSDDLGSSYGPGVLPYNGLTTKCGGLHGHVHVAADGTVWLPVNQCAGQQGGAFSTDAGTTWNEFIVAGNNDVNGGAPFTSAAQTHGADPSVGLDANSTAYYCYVSSEAGGTEGHAHVAVGKNTGSVTSPAITWIRDVDIGASHGIVNAAETEAVGGSAGRAACGFIGTNVPDSTGATYENGNFTGVWYIFIATTYDEGRTWVTVNATPNDPVQNHTGIWQGGGSGENGDRNLLDFNEITVDDKGRVLYGYSDGCHSLTCIQGDNSANERGGYMRVARQFGGKPLLSQFDITEPTVPKPACLSGTRDSSGVHLTWKIPDNGGADITSYRVFRATASGTETFLINTGNTKTTYTDITADPTQPVYYKVSAVNSVDSAGGTLSNEVNFPATPGIQLLSIASTKTHGSAGTFGVNLPLDGSGIECRTIGALPGGASGDYELVFTFANPLSGVGGASVTSGTGSILSNSIQNGVYVVTLTGVPNVQRLGVTLTNVSDSGGHTIASLTATMGVLIGDVNQTRGVDGNDVSAVQSHTRQSASASTFRFDVNATGGIDGNDVSLTQSKTRTSLP